LSSGERAVVLFDPWALKFVSTQSIDLRELRAGRTGYPGHVADTSDGLPCRDTVGPRTRSDMIVNAPTRLLDECCLGNGTGEMDGGARSQAPKPGNGYNSIIPLFFQTSFDA
jgi:hypothetical protein